VPSNGQLKWSFIHGNQVLPPAVANGVVYMGGGWPSNNTYALNATTGAKLWNYTSGSYIYSSPPSQMTLSTSGAWMANSTP